MSDEERAARAEALAARDGRGLPDPDAADEALVEARRELDEAGRWYSGVKGDKRANVLDSARSRWALALLTWAQALVDRETAHDAAHIAYVRGQDAPQKAEWGAAHPDEATRERDRRRAKEIDRHRYGASLPPDPPPGARPWHRYVPREAEPTTADARRRR